MEMSSINNSADTPNKRRRRECKFDDDYPMANKENNYMGMEVKSIAQMIADKTIENPFEVIRKPPKKKKKSDIENSCFVNPALNLNGPEVILNPFEIKRQPKMHQDDLCFINSGLNIRGPDKQIECGNAFEIVRGGCGIENPALDLKQSTHRMIAVPFTPNMGCRINFNDIPLESLTPCSMLTSKLTLESPKLTMTPKRSMKPTAATELSAISEEALNIGEELDCYQLELENSINEAKVDRNKQSNGKNLMDLKNTTSFARRLQLTEIEIAEMDKSAGDDDDDDTPIPAVIAEGILQEIPVEILNETPVEIPTESENRDVVFEEVADTSDDEFEFKNPAPFVRTYRRSTRKPFRTSITSQEKSTNVPKEKSSGFRNSIRKSIRKLIAPHSVKEKKPTSSMDEPSGSVFTTLRESFRRKAAPRLIDDNCGSNHDVSILVDADRKVFKQKPYEKYSDDALNSFGRKKSIRNSFRNTTKDVRRHVMKSVFKKNVEDYCLD